MGSMSPMGMMGSFTDRRPEQLDDLPPNEATPSARARSETTELDKKRRHHSSIKFAGHMDMIVQTSPKMGRNLQAYLNAEYEKKGWGWFRFKVMDILEAKTSGDTNIFDTAMGLVIIFNTIMMIIESDLGANCPRGEDCVYEWIKTMDLVLLAIYSVECGMRLFAFRILFFFSKSWAWNMLDMFIVLMGYVGLIMNAQNDGGSGASDSFKKLQMFRICRVARVVRVAKLLRRFPTLFNMISGFTGAMQAMFWGLLMILILLIMWSILAVEVIHPVVRDLVNASNTYALRNLTAMDGPQKPVEQLDECAKRRSARCLVRSCSSSRR